MTTTKPEITIPEVKLKADRLVVFGNTDGTGGSDGVRQWSMNLDGFNLADIGTFHKLVDQFNELESEFAQVAAKRREGAEVFVEGCDNWHGVMNEARIYGEVAERIRAILKAHNVYQDLPILPYQR